jgi:hypothetical protein
MTPLLDIAAIRAYCKNIASGYLAAAVRNTWGSTDRSFLFEAGAVKAP